MIVAALIATAAGFVGVAVGRATTRDQAAVEHKQWLRGQRQQAYIDFLTAWDRALEELLDDMDTLDRWEELMADWDGDPESAREQSYERVAAVASRVNTPRERVLLLGPDDVDALAGDMLANIIAMQTAVLGRLNPRSPNDPGWMQFAAVQMRSQQNRDEWLRRVKMVLRTAPKPT